MTQKTKLIDRILGKKAEAAQGAALASPVPIVSKVSKDFTRFDRFPGYEKMFVPKAAAERFGLANPFFVSHDGLAGGGEDPLRARDSGMSSPRVTLAGI